MVHVCPQCKSVMDPVTVHGVFFVECSHCDLKLYKSPVKGDKHKFVSHFGKVYSAMKFIEYIEITNPYKEYLEITNPYKVEEVV